MAVEIPLPQVQASAPHSTVTLGELRELIAAADLVQAPDHVIVRGKAIPFKFSDLGNQRGSCMNSLALDWKP